MAGGIQLVSGPGRGMEMVLWPSVGRNSASQIQVPLGEFLPLRIQEEGGCEPQSSPGVLVKASVTVLTLVVLAMESWLLDRGPSWLSIQVSVTGRSNILEILKFHSWCQVWKKRMLPGNQILLEVKRWLPRSCPTFSLNIFHSLLDPEPLGSSSGC